jgi:uncharacterized membrane protein
MAIQTTVPDSSALDRHIGVLLRTGMAVSASVILLGGVLFLLRHGSEVVDYHTFHGVPPELRSITGIANGAIHGHALPLIQFGLLLLIATPVLRVVFSVFGFAAEKDYLYTGIALIVLAVLLYSLFIH